MTDAREWLERVIDAANDEWLFRPVSAVRKTRAKFIVDALLAAGVPLPPEPPTPLKVWPGLEGEGWEQSQKVYHATYDTAVQAGTPYYDAARAARTAQTAHLFRALVASLPVLPDVAGLAGCVSVAGHYIPREALAALADPYDRVKEK